MTIVITCTIIVTISFSLSSLLEFVEIFLQYILGTGKTYTVIGPNNDVIQSTKDSASKLGIIPRAIHDGKDFDFFVFFTSFL
jgi:hypothetical protein